MPEGVVSSVTGRGGAGKHPQMLPVALAVALWQVGGGHMPHHAPGTHHLCIIHCDWVVGEGPKP